MYPFPKSVTPAAKSHLEAQLSFFNDFSKSLFRSVQQLSDLNLQLAQTLLEESVSTRHDILTANEPGQIYAATASHAQPLAGKLQAYQQHLSRLAADTQVDLSNVAEQHVPETSRTAKALAQEVARVASEETEKTVRTQQDAVKKFSDPFVQVAEAAQSRLSRGNEMRGGSTLQSAGGEGNQSGSTDNRESGQNLGSMQGGAGSGKPGGSARKE